MCEHAWFWLWAVVCGGDSSAALIFVLLMYDRSRFLLSDCLLCSSRSAQVCATNIKLRSFNLSAIGSTLTCRTDVWTRLMDCLRCSSRSAQVCAANAMLRPFSQSAIRSTLTRWTDVKHAWFWFCVVFVALTALQPWALCCWCMTVAVFSWWTAYFAVQNQLKFVQPISNYGPSTKVQRTHPDMPIRCVKTVDSDFELLFVAVTALQPRFLCCWCMTVAVFYWVIAFFAVQDQLKFVQQIFN